MGEGLSPEGLMNRTSRGIGPRALPDLNLMSRNKGNKGEREVVKMLQPWWQKIERSCAFVRTPVSGGWGGPSLRSEFRASGDLMTTAKLWPFAVEVKRRGEIDGVEQLTRYLEFLNRDHRLAPVRGLLVAQIVKPQARTLAEDRGIGWREVDYEELAGAESDVLRLF
ncbi:MAG: DUF91 domain-containing protein [Acidobacteria bacterium]|nr:DUF91 domain-containing protein [Acidobacteriota bacterium]